MATSRVTSAETRLKNPMFRARLTSKYGVPQRGAPARGVSASSVEN